MGNPAKFLLLLLCFYCADGEECSSDQLMCQNGRCVVLRYLCDGDNDCGDNSDEAVDFCEALSNENCSRGEAQCHRLDDASCLPIKDYCEASDPACKGDLDPRICKILSERKLQFLDDIRIPFHGNLNASRLREEEFRHLMNFTLSHPSCPPLFTLVGDKCLSVLFTSNVTWGESHQMCQLIGGELVSFRNVSHFASVIQHLKESQLSADFWIGGRYLNDEWAWMDGSPMEIGSPYWAVRYNNPCEPRTISFPTVNITRPANDGVCYNYFQAPGKEAFGECVALTFQHFYYMSDEDCLLRKSPLCVAVRGG